MIEKITEYWQLLLAIGTATGAIVRWKIIRTKDKEQSTQMLYDELEKLKKKVILQVSEEVHHSTIVAEKQRIIEGLRLHCPECYKTYTEKNNDEI